MRPNQTLQPTPSRRDSFLLMIRILQQTASAPSLGAAELGLVRSMHVTPVCLILSLSFVTAVIAQPNRASDEPAIRATVTDYIDGYYLSDPARMERSLHPHYSKRTISESNGELMIVDKTGMEMVQEVRNKKEVTPASQRKKAISILVVDGDVASVKLVAIAWTNYITLLKQNGEWTILSVVKRNHF